MFQRLIKLISGMSLGLICLSAQAINYGFTEYSDFNYESLVELIESKNVTSVEAALKELKNEKPELFDTFILMYRSKSLQKGSFLAPRALLFEGSGRLVVSFNGDPKDYTGYNKLEVMQFRDDTKKFEFREIAFRDGQPPQFSQANPAKCMQCHQSPDRKNIDPRPNWEPYNVWPGAYGSDFGRVNPMSPNDIRELESQDQQHIEDQAQEQVMIKKFFQEVKPDHPRYKFLGQEKLSLDSAQRSDYNSFAALTKNFTDILGRLNFRRVIRILKTEWSAQWEYLGPTVAGIGKCRKLFIDKENVEWHLARVPEEYIAEPPSGELVKINTELARLRYQLSQDANLSRDAIEAAVALRKENLEKEKVYSEFRTSQALWVLFEPLGISIRDWSMDFQTQGRLAAFERFGIPSDPKAALKEALEIVAPELHALSCEELEARSLDGMRRYKQSQLFFDTLAQRQQLEMNREPLISRCISCHTELSGAAPYIAFDNEAKLREQLNSFYNGRTLLEEIRYRLSDHATLEDQMPRGLGRPSLGERRSLVEYLESLVK